MLDYTAMNRRIGPELVARGQAACWRLLTAAPSSRTDSMRCRSNTGALALFARRRSR